MYMFLIYSVSGLSFCHLPSTIPRYKEIKEKKVVSLQVISLQVVIESSWWSEGDIEISVNLNLENYGITICQYLLQ